MSGHMETATTVQAGADLYKYPDGKMGWIRNIKIVLTHLYVNHCQHN